jgi:hypothetical protein
MIRIHHNRFIVRYIIPVLSFLLIFAGSRAYSQNNSQDTIPRTPGQERRYERQQRIHELQRREEEGMLVYNKQWDLGIKLNSDGYGISWEMGWMKSLRWTNLLQVEINEKKDPKEYKTSVAINGGYDEGSSFIYGKQNYFYQVKFGYGQQYMIGGKGNKNGVAVSAIYAGGLSVGILRPYLVQVNNNLGQTQNIRYNSADSAEFLNDVIGGTGLGTGWDELAIKPGLHAKAAMRFDYGKYNELLSAIEVGINAEEYFSKVPIMVIAPNHSFFFNSYITILFGKRK